MPYFFNFHSGNNANTLIVGNDSRKRNLLTNFLISQAQRFEGRTFYIDRSGASKAFVESIGGKYFNDISGFVSALNSEEAGLNADVPNLVIFNGFIDSQLETLANSLMEKNTVVIFSIDEANMKELSETFFKSFVSKIYLHNPKITENFKTLFNIKEADAKIIKNLDAEKFEFLLKKAGVSTILNMEIKNLRPFENLLGGEVN